MGGGRNDGVRQASDKVFELRDWLDLQKMVAAVALYEVFGVFSIVRLFPISCSLSPQVSLSPNGEVHDRD